MLDLACQTLSRNVRVARHLLCVGAEHLEGADEGAAMALRLADDMFPLADQIKLTAYFAQAGAARVIGAVPPALPDAPTGWASADVMFAAAAGDVAAVAAGPHVSPDLPVDFLVQGKPVRCAVSHLLFAHLIPNQYFHLSIIYALLRQAGAPLGKIDFLSRDMLNQYAVA